jgi:hypothetical protein
MEIMLTAFAPIATLFNSIWGCAMMIVSWSFSGSHTRICWAAKWRRTELHFAGVTFPGLLAPQPVLLGCYWIALRHRILLIVAVNLAVCKSGAAKKIRMEKRIGITGIAFWIWSILLLHYDCDLILISGK